MPRLTFCVTSKVKGQGYQAALGGCSRHHLQGAGHMVAAALQAAQLVIVR